MAVAKVFRTGRSQAIRLPKEFRVVADTVHLKRTSEGFLVITKDPWEIFFEGVEQLSDKFLGATRATRAGITGLIAVLYILDTDMVVFMLRGLKGAGPARHPP